MGIMDSLFGADAGANNWWYWNAIIQQQEQQRLANEAAAQQAAAQQAATAATAGQAVNTAAAAAPATQPVFDPAPYRGIVDAGFSQFTPEFYATQYQNAFNPYKSGVENQFGLAKDVLTAGLAKKGLGTTPQGRGVFQQLEALRDQELGKGQTAAQGFQTGLTGAVDTAKQGLYGSIGAGADNASLGTRTKAEADRIFGTKPPVSTLGSDVFGSFVEPYASGADPAGPALSFGGAQGTGGLNLAGAATGPAASAKVIGGKKKR